MKISFVTTGDIQSIATSKRAFGLAEPLRRLGYEVSILLEDTPNNRMRIQQEAPSAQAYWFQPGKAFEEARQKRRILRDLRPDFVYVSSVGIRNFVWSRSLSKSSSLVIEHSELASSIQNQPGTRRIASFALEKASLFFFSGHVVASRYLEMYIGKELARYWQSRAVHYSPYAYSPSMLNAKPEVSSKLRSVVGSRKTVVYMGTLSRNYGILDIIRTVPILKNKYPNVLLMVLGKGRDGDVAKTLVDSLGLKSHVCLEGYVSDDVMPSYFELADVFIAPLYSTIQDIARCPSKLFLYLPFRRPIVTSQIGEAKELFGNYDYYFQPGDIQDMAVVISKALSAAPDWNPPWSFEQHSWESRAHDLNIWLHKLSARTAGR